METWIKQIFGFVFFFSFFLSFGLMQYIGKSFAHNEFVEVDFEPDVLNLRSQGKWVTCFLKVVAEGYSVENINVSSILLFNELPMNWSRIEDEKLMIKFDRALLIALLMRMFPPQPYEKFKYIDVEISGAFLDGKSFTSFDRIEVIYI